MKVPSPLNHAFPSFSSMASPIETILWPSDILDADRQPAASGGHTVAPVIDYEPLSEQDAGRRHIDADGFSQPERI